MGYIQNSLPKYLARCGAEVHVISMNLSPNHNVTGAKEIFQEFTEQLLPGSIEELDGFQLHVLDHRLVHGYPRMMGLSSKLTSLRPDVVQCQASIGWIPLDAARIKLLLGYKLFSGNHNAMSTSSSLLGRGGAFKNRAKSFLERFVPGALRAMQ